MMQQYNDIAKKRAQELSEKLKNKQQSQQNRAGSLALQKRVSTLQQRQSADGGDGKLPPIQKSLADQERKPAKKPEKDKKEHWLKLLELEHADALISDSFWYVICKICNPQPDFEQH